MVDSVGRRRSFVLSFLGCAVPLLLLWHDAETASSLHVLIYASISLFFMTFLLGGIYVYAPEIYPTRSEPLALASSAPGFASARSSGPRLSASSLRT